MKLRTDHPQMIAAAKAGLSVATARRIDLDPRPASAKKQRRIYRTRPDPLGGLWDEEILPLLTAAPGLRPITLFDELARRHPDRIGPSFRRTLERRVADWKARHGSNVDVIFPQIQQPGRMGLSDFTDANGFGVIVGGQRLEHRLYHFALAFSGFEHAEVILGGESYAALASGLENALRLLGGVPREHRSDSLSAAFRNLAMPDAEDLTRRFAALVTHFGMVPTRNNRGVAHETCPWALVPRDGAIESRNGHVKTRITQALLLRGSSLFDDLEAYRGFVAGVIGQHNRRHAAMIDAERAVLRPLPTAPAMTWEAMTVRVTSASGFMCRHVFYTVPSRLVGHRLHLRIHDDRIEAYLGGSFVLALPRGRRPKSLPLRRRGAPMRRSMSSITATSSPLCEPNRVRWPIWPIVTPSGHAPLTGAPGKPSSRPVRRATPPAPWSACSPSRTIAVWRLIWPPRSMPDLTRATRQTSPRCCAGSRPRRRPRRRSW